MLGKNACVLCLSGNYLTVNDHRSSGRHEFLLLLRMFSPTALSCGSGTSSGEHKMSCTSWPPLDGFVRPWDCRASGFVFEGLRKLFSVNHVLASSCAPKRTQTKCRDTLHWGKYQGLVSSWLFYFTPVSGRHIGVHCNSWCTCAVGVFPLQLFNTSDKLFFNKQRRNDGRRQLVNNRNRITF